jgi:hypothetical protein
MGSDGFTSCTTADHATRCSCQAGQLCGICDAPNLPSTEQHMTTPLIPYWHPHPHTAIAGQELCSICGERLDEPKPTTFTLRQRTQISHAFDAGNSDSVYGKSKVRKMQPHERAAYILGFYSSFELSEIPDRPCYDAAYNSPAGRYCVEAGFIDSRADAAEGK